MSQPAGDIAAYQSIDQADSDSRNQRDFMMHGASAMECRERLSLFQDFGSGFCSPLGGSCITSLHCSSTAADEQCRLWRR